MLNHEMLSHMWGTHQVVDGARVVAADPARDVHQHPIHMVAVGDGGGPEMILLTTCVQTPVTKSG